MAKNTPAQQGQGDREGDVMDPRREFPGAGGDDVRGIADEEGDPLEDEDMDDLEEDEEDDARR